ncbi:TetR family transcriptional regulator [Lysinibacillus sp. 2017]|uniref:TetR/AcrR family transcriptional regulator n=1 Tax=unclassified Lysinibacillus TaxID=2636778 RepID=UPI000D52A130|nr:MULTISPECIES: TetR/AcrR family transcriptional regulator [unclassified Lysinibacillus]AWE06276.1 TetR family transcriptional regulator [Lysinibacillus sp. 2017]TGN35248.1 TetR/AcrR family transcriptional regulator [Lysinibacillus sp. S2017]
MTNVDKLHVASSIKDENKILERRQQIVDAGVKLFKKKGFHRATTRELAKEAGFSIGTLYEYIRTKEDVLFLVCDNIFNEVTICLSEFTTGTGTIEGLKDAIRRYFLLIDTMPEEFTIMYQETKSLPKEAMHYILDKELEMVAIFERMLRDCIEAGNLSLSEEAIFLAANHIVIQGQSWAFRKWALQKRYTIEQYIELQTTMFLQGILQFEQ